MKIFWIYVCAVLAVVIAGGVYTYTGYAAVKDADNKAIALEFVDSLAKGDFTAATEHFDATMKAAMPAEDLKRLWTSLNSDLQGFKRHTGTRTEAIGPYEAVFVTCEFGKESIDLKVVFNDRKEIGGLWYLPSPSAESLKTPEYVKNEKFTETEVIVGSGEWALPGTLTMPVGNGPFPGVVLVHGSGPNDRDETIGPNKPFRDLAWGLASKGIAVLRYEKRTKQYQWQMAGLKDITVQDETIDDALDGVQLLRVNLKIDPKRVYVLGHSLGGMLIPRMWTEDSAIAGYVIMAGATRPMEDMIIEQTRYIMSLDPSGQSKDAQAQLKKLEEQCSRVKNPKLSKSTAARDLPFGVPASYWLDLRGYKPAEVARSIKRPMLILQGGRDYQVTDKDFQNWKNALSSRKNVQFKLYPKLNHLFIAGEGKCTPAEYEIPGHVSDEVIMDIARWITGKGTGNPHG